MGSRRGPGDPKPDSGTPGYWLGVCNGLEAMRLWVFMETSAEEFPHLLMKFPVLALPEFVTALEDLAHGMTGTQIGQQLSGGAECLKKIHAELRQNSPTTYARMLGGCGAALTTEYLGDRSINIRRAIELFTEARSVVPQDSSDFAICLRDEGVARQGLAELGVDARDNLEKALRLYHTAQKVFPEHSPDLAYCLMNEGGARVELSDLGVDQRTNVEEALRLYDQAGHMLSPDDPEVPSCLMNHGIVHTSLADLGLQAEANLADALRLYSQARTRYPPNSPEYARCLMNEGAARQSLAKRGVQAQENLETAVRMYQEAGSIFPPDNPSFARCLMNEGDARCELAEKHIKAEENLDEAVRLYDKARAAFPSNGPSFAHCLVNEGSARWSLARLRVAAEENLEKARRLYAEAGSRLQELGFNLGAIEAHKGLVEVAFLQSDWEMIRIGCEQAIRALEEVRASMLLVRDRHSWMEQNIGFFKGMVEACIRRQSYEEAVEYVERARSRTLVDLLYMEEMEPRNIPKQQAEAYRELRQRAQELEALLSQEEAKTHTEGNAKHQGMLLPLMQEKSEVLRSLSTLEEELRRKDPDFFALAKPLSLDEMTELAKEMKRTLILLWVGPLQAMAFFVRPSGEFDRLALPGVTDAVVKEWMLGRAGGRSQNGWIGTYRRYRRRKVTRQAWMDQMDQTLSHVYEALMQPIHLWLKERGEQRVVFVVAGYLGLLPLHAASWRENGQVHHLIEELEVVYSPSAWVLKRCVERTREQWKPVLGIANPEVKGQTSLPFSELEVGRIEALVAKRQGKRAFYLLTGANATVEKILEVLPYHPVVHFSCHGQWDFEEPLRSALMLAGGNLTLAHLLWQVRLHEAHLVVLSTCESGTGHRPESAGEEYLGLPAGFILAGAKSVVGSLWAAFDPATALLMVKMYENLLEGMGVAAALRQAQLWLRALDRHEAASHVEHAVETVSARLPRALLEGYRTRLAHLGTTPFAHPYYWAAFEVFGSPEPVI